MKNKECFLSALRPACRSQSQSANVMEDGGVEESSERKETLMLNSEDLVSMEAV